MGVVKNLIVRIGADVRGVVSGMKTAYSSTRQATSQIRSATDGMKQSVKDSFAGSRMSIREYSETVAGLKASHNAAAQNTERLQDRLDQLQSTYDSLKSGTGKKIRASEYFEKMEVLPEEIKSLQQELDISKIKAGELEQKLHAMSIPQIIKNEIKSIGAAAGAGARAGVSQLWQNVKKLGGDAVRGVASLGSRLLGIGRNASSSNRSLERMVRSIRNVGIVALGMRVFRGIFGELQGIISNYIRQNEALNATVTNMKNQLGQALEPAINAIIAAMQRLMPVIQSIASVINAVFTSLFGKVKSTTAGIKSSADAAKSAADKLNTYSFDQINKESDDSGTSGSSSATADFGEKPAWLTSVLGWVDQLKAAFKAGDWKGLGRIAGEGINALVDSFNAVDIGAKVGSFINNLYTTLHSALSTIDFAAIGKKAGEFVTSGFRQINWNTVGETVGRALTSIPSMIVGFLQNTDWKQIASSISSTIVNTLNSVSSWIKTTNWSSLGESVGSLLSGIDWMGVFSALGSLLWEGFKASLEALGGFIRGLGPEIITAAISSVISVISLSIAGKALLAPLLVAIKAALTTAATTIVAAIGGWPALIIAAGAAAVAGIAVWMKNGGSDVAAGFFEGIKSKMSSIGTWIKDNIFTPFIEGFKSAFGIHSPSTVMEKQGSYLGEGLLIGFRKKWQEMLGLLTSGLRTIQTSITEAWTRCSTTTSQKWSEISQKFTTKVTEMRNAASEKFQNIRETISMAWAEIQANCTSAVSVITTGVVNGFNWMKVGVGNAFSSMWSNVRSWINALIGGVEHMVNSVIRGVNRLIDGFNRNLGALGEAIGLDVYISRINTVTLPRLEYGGVTTGPTRALIGEAGQEVVLPLQRHTGWMDTLVNKIQAGGNVSNSGTPLIIQLMLGNRKVTEYVIKDINQITRTTGVCPIKV